MTDPNVTPPHVPLTSEPHVTASVPVTPHAEPGDDEVVYFDGRPTLRADQFKAMVWLIVGVIIVALPILAWHFSWGGPWWLWLAVAVIGLIVIVAPWLTILATRYRITNYRIDYERGVLSKRIDTLELWHVDDIDFRQSLLDRIMGIGSIIVLSNDKTTPRLELHGVPHPREIFDALKQRVIAVKRQRGVIKMDTGT
jgi:membrane protein YdbS with pleckstrin-like domain